MRILKAPLRFSSLNSSCTSLVVLVIIECCLNAALSNHVDTLKLLKIFLNILTALSFPFSDWEAALSSATIFYSKYYNVSGIFPPSLSFSISYKGSQRMHLSSFSAFSAFSAYFSFSFSLSLSFSLDLSATCRNMSSLAPAAKLHALSRFPVGAGSSMVALLLANIL
jgi:hypothetical protein